MGLLGNLFAPKIDYPSIDPNSAAAQRIAEVESQLEVLAGKVSERLEVVPSEHAAYVFIGKPPSKFGRMTFRRVSASNCPLCNRPPTNRVWCFICSMCCNSAV